jgi:hypothetical protein
MPGDQRTRTVPERLAATSASPDTALLGTEEAWTPYYRNDDQFSIRGNFTKSFRNHEIRWGTDNNTERMNHTQPEFQGGASMGARGRFIFGTGPYISCA